MWSLKKEPFRWNSWLWRPELIAVSEKISVKKCGSSKGVSESPLLLSETQPANALSRCSVVSGHYNVAREAGLHNSDLKFRSLSYVYLTFSSVCGGKRSVPSADLRNDHKHKTFRLLLTIHFTEVGDRTR